MGNKNYSIINHITLEEAKTFYDNSKKWNN